MKIYSNTEAINYIYKYSKYYGNVLYECEELYKEERGFILLITFFNMIENIIKSINEDYEASFGKNINKLKYKLSEQEIDFLYYIKDLRNHYAHADLNSFILEIEGVAYILSEDTTAITLYEMLSNITYNILVKIINNKINN